MRQLDRIDVGLLAALQEDARQTVKELAARVGLSPSATHERVRALTRDGIVTGTHAAVDPRALGIGLQALVQVQLRHHERDSVATFRSHALGLPETVAVTHLTGTVDFLVHVAVRDTDHLRALTLESFTTRPEVSRIETSIIYEHVATPTWPVYALAE